MKRKQRHYEKNRMYSMRSEYRLLKAKKEANDHSCSTSASAEEIDIFGRAFVN